MRTKILRHRLSVRTVVATFSAAGALAGAEEAGAALAPNTVGSTQIKNYSIKPVDLAANVINGSRCTWGPKTGQNYLFRPKFDPATNPGYAQSAVWCLVRDRFEPNNTDGTPYNLNGVDYRDNLASMYPSGNHDWYVNSVSARYVFVYAPVVEGLPTTVEVFKNGVEQTLNYGSPAGDYWGFNNGLAEPATWVLHVASTRPLPYRFGIGTSGY